MATSRSGEARRQVRIVLAALLVAAAALLVGAPTATATTYNDSRGGSDSQATTTLNYTRAHSSGFGLRIYVKTNGTAGVSDKYSISLLDSSGQTLRSFTDQGDRTYTIGANVVSIVVVRNSGQGAKTYWQRKAAPPICSSC